MIIMSLTNEFGLTEGKMYKVLEESAGYYKVRIDNGGTSFRRTNLFKIVPSPSYKKEGK